MPKPCTRLVELEKQVVEVLQILRELTTAQLEAFRKRDQPKFMRLDKELENTVALKERTIGALRQHVREHGCQPS
jgi:hypothetical protein